MPSHTIQILVNGARGTRRRGPGACAGCGRKIWWCATVAKKPIPFDEAPDVISLDGDVETVSTEHVHWATCSARSHS
jgi:predicted DNA-binding protein with PD1-like motif